MKDLSLNILDVAHNSIRAGARLTEITMDWQEAVLTVTIKDNGCGMSKEMLETVTDPFTTSRTTRRVGMGLPLFKLAAEQTGGQLQIESELGVGTTVTAVFHTDHIDCPPAGDIASTAALIAGALKDDMDLIFTERNGQNEFCLDTAQIREVLGPDIPLSDPSVQAWLTEYMEEQEKTIR